MSQMRRGEARPSQCRVIDRLYGPGSSVLEGDPIEDWISPRAYFTRSRHVLARGPVRPPETKGSGKTATLWIYVVVSGGHKQSCLQCKAAPPRGPQDMRLTPLGFLGTGWDVVDSIDGHIAMSLPTSSPTLRQSLAAFCLDRGAIATACSAGHVCQCLLIIVANLAVAWSHCIHHFPAP